MIRRAFRASASPVTTSGEWSTSSAFNVSPQEIGLVGAIPVALLPTTPASVAAGVSGQPSGHPRA